MSLFSSTLETSAETRQGSVLSGIRGPAMIVTLFFAIASVGCGILGDSGSNSASNGGETTANSEKTETPSETTTAKPSEVASGPCVNQFYPIEPGVKKEYELTSKIKGGDTGMILSQKAPEGDSFTEVRTLNSGTTVTTPWKCTADGLRVAEYENFIDSKVGNFTMKTLESSGTTIPASWKKGDEWESDYKIRVNLKAGPVNTSADGTVTITNQLVAENERVKVKGGEFDAARVDAEIAIVISMQGATVPKQTIKLSRWYSPKVGLVKQEVYGSYGNETMEYAGTASP